MQRFIIPTLVLVLAATAGFYSQRYFLADNDSLPAKMPVAKTSVIGKTRPDFSYKDIEGDMRQAKEWDGKVLLVNFWATWCPPCKKEIPAFIALQEQYAEKGFQIIGIALDDEESVKDYADSMGMNYPVMAAEVDAIQLARDYGNRVNALPFSAFIDRSGKIVKIKAGGLSKAATEKIILPLL